MESAYHYRYIVNWCKLYIENFRKYRLMWDRMETLKEERGGTLNLGTKDMIVGSIANYGIDNIKNWVNSLNLSGFTGEKRALCYNLSEDVIEFLEDHGFSCHACQLKESHIFVQRFYDQWHILSRLDASNYRYIIATDTRDVIFQSNPSEWLERNLGEKKIMASSECIRFVDEDWGNKTLKSCYGHLYEDFSRIIVYNAGTIAGEFKAMRDFFLNVYQFGLSADAAESDQPALNILINLEHIKPLVKFARQGDGWCAQLGASMDPNTIESYRPKLLEPSPRIDDNGIVFNHNDIPFALVHQYDRISGLSDLIDRRYGGVTRNPIAQAAYSKDQKSSGIREKVCGFQKYCYGTLKRLNRNIFGSYIKIINKIKKGLLSRN